MLNAAVRLRRLSSVVSTRLVVSLALLTLVTAGSWFGVSAEFGRAESHQQPAADTNAPLATFTVINANDSGAGSLRQAILDANASAAADTIVFDPAFFNTPQTITLASGTLSITGGAGALTIAGPGSNLLTVSGNSASRVFTVGGNSVVSISGMAIKNGSTGSGAGINSANATVTLTNLLFENNRATNLGGGIYQNGGQLTVTGCSIVGNRAQGSATGAGFGGGGIYLEGTTVANISNSTISDNLASGTPSYRGGGIFISNSQTTISNSIVRSNVAILEGGGLHYSAVLTTSSLNITDSTFSQNTVNPDAAANTGFGAGLNLESTGGAGVTIERSTIYENLANRTTTTNGGEGGGIYAAATSVSLVNSTVSGNVAGNRGGGIFDENTGGGTGGAVTIDSSTIVDNSAIVNGGGLSVAPTTPLAAVTDIRNSIFANNAATSGTGPDINGTVDSQGFNLVENTSGASLAGIATGNITGQDPNLAVLANNGGPTQTHALNAGSPAIDKGASGTLTTDQRGLTRPYDNPAIANASGGNGSDIGAFEVQPAGATPTPTATPTVVPTPTFTPTATPTPGPAGGIVYAIDGRVSPSRLISFSAAQPGVILSSVAFTGLAANEFLIGLDFRPANGMLYSVATTFNSPNSSRVVTVDPATGAVGSVGAGLTPALPAFSYGFDFNPVVDRIRVVGEDDRNIRLNPNDGTYSGVDTNLAFAPGDVNAGDNPVVTEAAYTNNTAGATVTTLYGIDAGNDVLVRIGGVDGTPSPNGGQLTTVGPLGVNIVGIGGFDIQGGSEIAYAVLTAGNNQSALYRINLATGATTSLGAVGAALRPESDKQDRPDGLAAIFGMAITPAGGPTPTPTPVASPTPTVAPSPTPTIAPSPTPTVAPSPTPTGSPTPTPTPATRALRVINTAVQPGQTATVSIVLDSLGNEASTSFSLNFDPAVLTSPVVTLGSGVPAGSNLATNTSQAAQGRIGVLVDSTNAYAAGTREVLRVTFTVPATASIGLYPVTFGSTPTLQSVSNTQGSLLTTLYTTGGVQVGSTAAGVSVSGRVLTPDGRGLRNAQVTIAGPDGIRRTVTTGSFGYYRFDDVEAGSSFVIGVMSRRYRFAPQSVRLTDTLTEIDFVGQN